MPDAQSGRAIVIRVRDTKALAAAQGGSAAELAASLVPDYVDAKVYEEMAKKLRDALGAEHVSADVSIVDAGNIPGGILPAIPASDGHAFIKGLAIGGGAIVVAMLGYELLFGERHHALPPR